MMLKEAAKHVHLRTLLVTLVVFTTSGIFVWLMTCSRRSLLIDLSLDGASVDAILKDAGVDSEDNLEIVLKIPQSLDTVIRLRQKGFKIRNITRKNPSTRTFYPLTIDSPYVINNPYICTNVTNLKFLVIVHSATGNFQRRRLIRETWANKNLFKHLNVRIVFLFGLTKDKKHQSLIENESVVYGDIVQGNFLDTYHNLTHKGVLSFRWISEHCLNTDMILKVDDDVFVNPFILMETFYPRLKSKDRHILCHLRKIGTSPIVRHQSKWQVDADEFKGYTHYPIKYCNGYVVLISPEIIRAMYRASYLTPFFWVDDVYLYGLLPYKAGKVIHEEIRGDMTLNVNTGLTCYTKKKKCGYLAVNAWKDGSIETLWLAALNQTSSVMKAQINPLLAGLGTYTGL